ncbi:aminoacyl-tRNA hydrolase [Patescibacteria group bacterium]|nr:aminoacyl-tRNA hydrolase [Patescibacteria group bacterium]MBU1877100.1 aminoacyl-tRNA hydrolase [Patescibacteria group bacterium]
MLIIVGLGNPGDKFKNTRHNVGFMTLDKIKEKNDFPDFNLSKKFQAKMSESFWNNDKVILVKPQTFMNESGKAVRRIIENYKLKIVDLLVIHDDIDILIGKVKFSKDSSSAGHKGVQSIINILKSKNFARLRIGILPQKGKTRKTEEFVLQKFSQEEKGVIEKIIEFIGESIKNENVQ